MPSVPYLVNTVPPPVCSGGSGDPHQPFDMFPDGWDPVTGFPMTQYFHCRRCGRRLAVTVAQAPSEPPPGWKPEV